jgi:hypothetical protein
MILDLIYPSFSRMELIRVCGYRSCSENLGESHENKYGANERAQMLKYHIQTSGRSCTHKKLISMISVRLYKVRDL